MAKMGRPKSDDPMNYRFTIRFSNVRLAECIQQMKLKQK